MQRPFSFAQLLNKTWWGRSLVVLSILALFISCIMLALYLTAPKIQFSLKQLDCSPITIEERNKHSSNKHEDACIIKITIKNLEPEVTTLDLGDMSGPGPADWGGEPAIRIYARDGAFCYGSVNYIDLQAHESKDIDLICQLDSRHAAIDDVSIDARPDYVIIDYNFSKRRIEL